MPYCRYVDRSATKNEIRDALISIAAENGELLSQSRANNLADRFKKGKFDPELLCRLTYRDPTGEEAVRNIEISTRPGAR